MRLLSGFTVATFMATSILAGTSNGPIDRIPVRNWQSASRITPNALGTNSVFVAIAPCRIYDTRLADAPILPAATERTFTVAGRCSVPVASAYSLNIVVTGSTDDGQFHFLTAWPADLARPLASSLNYRSGNQVGNAAVVPASATGAIGIYSSASTEVIIDINGYYVDAPPAGSTITSVSAGTGLTGGGNTGALTLGIADGGVDTQQLADTAVTTAKIDTQAVTTNEIADLTILSGDLAANSVTTVKIQNGQVTAAKINSETATANMALVANGSSGATWANVITAVNNSKVHLAEVADNICVLANGFSATTVTMGGINGNAGSNAVVVVTPNGGLDSTRTDFPPVAVAFLSTANGTCTVSNKWIIYSTDIAKPILDGMRFNILGLR